MTSPKQRSNIDVTLTSQTACRPETTRSSIANANSDRLQIKTVKLTGNTRGQDHIQSQRNNSGQAWRHVYSNTPGFSQGTGNLRQLRRRRRSGVMDSATAAKLVYSRSCLARFMFQPTARLFLFIDCL